MENAQTIYQNTVLPLPDSEKLRLATLILENLSRKSEGKNDSAYDLLKNLSGERAFSSSEEVDEHLKAERESWDN